MCYPLQSFPTLNLLDKEEIHDNITITSTIHDNDMQAVTYELYHRGREEGRTGKINTH